MPGGKGSVFADDVLKLILNATPLVLMVQTVLAEFLIQVRMVQLRSLT
jgi:hypothetical protein